MVVSRPLVPVVRLSLAVENLPVSHFAVNKTTVVVLRVDGILHLVHHLFHANTLLKGKEGFDGDLKLNSAGCHGCGSGCLVDSVIIACLVGQMEDKVDSSESVRPSPLVPVTELTADPESDWRKTMPGHSYADRQRHPSESPYHF